MEKGLVSVIMPTYNSGKFIKESIYSALKQTYNNLEVIVVDDCSTDNTKEIVEEIIKEDSRVKYYILDTNSGAAVARTKAIKKACGKYIAFLDSDDIWYQNKLNEQIKFMEDNDYNFTCTDYEKMDEDGNKLNKIMKSRTKADYNDILMCCPVGNSTVVFNAEKLGKFEVPNIRKRNDDALWLKMLKKEKYVYGLKKVLMTYRVRKNSISSNKFSLIKYHWYLYRKIEHLSVARSVFHICCWGFIKVFRIK